MLRWRHRRREAYGDHAVLTLSTDIAFAGRELSI
jgi:hypothetical protein